MNTTHKHWCGHKHSDSTAVRSQSSRALHLWDLDNLLGGSRASITSTSLRALLVAYDRSISIRDRDHVVVAACAAVAARTFFDLPIGWRFLVGRGLDGADLALVNAIPVKFIASRYTDVVIGSGDGIFSNFAADLTSCGLSVTVVARARSLSQRLRSVADKLILLPSDVTMDIAA